MAREVAPQITEDDVRWGYVRLVRSQGRPAPTGIVLRLQEPLDDSGETDCWTHARRYAERTGATYVEGVCDRGRGVSVHAWCEETSPLGVRVVVELTKGYENARDYWGVPVDIHSDVAKDSLLNDVYYSVLELAVGRSMLLEARPARRKR